MAVFSMPPLSSSSGMHVLVQQRCTRDHHCVGSLAGTHTRFINGACTPDSGRAASYHLMHKVEPMAVMMTEACAALSSPGTHQFPTPTARISMPMINATSLLDLLSPHYINSHLSLATEHTMANLDLEHHTVDLSLEPTNATTTIPRGLAI
jgi:hypothetical protein